MDPIEPILPDRPSVLPVYPAQRTGRVHRDARGGGGGQGGHRRPPREEDGVEVDIGGVDGSADESELDAPASALQLDPAHPAHRLQLTAGDDGEPPAHHIDLSA